MESNTQPPLSLKVMRVSRPSLASQWQPFFSSSPSFSAHASANALSLQGAEPLSGYPKTLRDLTHAGQMLTLPVAFGAIHLGETFSCCVCVNNDSSTDVQAVYVKIELQTAGCKVVLDEVGGTDRVLSPFDILETVVTYEVKELGQHVLACTVSYQSPAFAQNAPHNQEQTFRKFYKFAVTNPLSVKTKVHTPSSPAVLFSPDEREKVLLEVQIQNLKQSPLWIEHIRLMPVDGWAVETQDPMSHSSDALSQVVKPRDLDNLVYNESLALMHPQDTRQYVYVLCPMPFPDEPRCVQPTLPPGTIIPLGRLDIVWRSSMGEPGRLITSPLTRRIAVPPPPVTVNPTQVTAYRQRIQTHGSTTSAPPSRTQSPHPSTQVRALQHPSIQRVASPPPRPSSPLRRESTAASRPGSPKPVAGQDALGDFDGGPREVASVDVKAIGVNVDLTVTNAQDFARVDLAQPFTLNFELVVAGTLPHQPQQPAPSAESPRHRVVKLAVQHVLAPAQVARKNSSISIDNVVLEDAFASIIGSLGQSGYSTPRSGDGQSPISPLSVGNSSAATLVGLPVRPASIRQRTVIPSNPSQNLHSSTLVSLQQVHNVPFPSPFSQPTSVHNKKSDTTGRIAPLGATLTILPLLHLTPHTHPRPTLPSGPALTHEHPVTHGFARQEFSLSYTPISRGFSEIGGLRVLLLGDWEIAGSGQTYDMEEFTKIEPPRVLRSWDVIGELWVH